MPEFRVPATDSDVGAIASVTGWETGTSVGR